MAKRTAEQKLMNKWWMHLLVALVFLGLGYGFASLAIDSGSWLAYALAILFLVLTIKQTVRGAARYLSLRKR